MRKRSYAGDDHVVLVMKVLGRQEQWFWEGQSFWRDFFTSAGFGGLMAFCAAFIAAGAAVFAAVCSAKSHQAELKQRDTHHAAVQGSTDTKIGDDARAAAIERCWTRLVWLVDTTTIAGSSESTKTVLSIDLAIQIGDQLEGDAEKLKDETLQIAVIAYVTELGLLLSRQPRIIGSGSGGVSA